MSDIQGIFLSHRVNDDNSLTINAVTPGSFYANIQITVSREEAEQFGWVDPLEGETELEAYEHLVSEARDRYMSQVVALRQRIMGQAPDPDLWGILYEGLNRLLEDIQKGI